MRYLSVCSGIEAASVAWHPLGWSPIAFSEIDPFPSAVLAHRYGSNMPGEDLSSNGVPNLGDMTKFREWPDYADVDVLVGGTPCQDYSIAGKRAGMAGERGQLTLTFVELLERYRPTWFVWENVPGVLSSNGGRDFATFLRDVGECGYGWAYRVLDAQYVRTCGRPVAVPQRRRRVFVVGYLGDWRPPAAVFLEPEGMRGNPAPRRKAGQGFAGVAGASSARGSHWDGTGCHPSLNQSHNTGGIGASNQEIFSQRGAGLVCAEIAPTLNAHFGEKQGLEDQHINGGGAYLSPPVANPLTARMHKGINTTLDEGQTLIANGGVIDAAHTLKGEGFDASEDGTGRGLPLVPVAFDCKGTEVQFSTDGSHPTLRSMGHANSHQNAGGHAAVASPIPFDLNQITSKTNRSQPSSEVHHTLPATAMPPHLASPLAVRRLSPTECERLQGFPDNWTDVPYRNRKAADGPRYKALGNSMAVNCMEYIGRRIDLVRIAMAENQAAREAAE